MLANYIRVSLRSGVRQRFFSSINIAGLAVGLAACWLLSVYFFHERTFDNFLPQADRICAVALDLKMGDTEAVTTNTPPPLGLRLASDYPEVEMTARSFDLGEVVVRYDRPDHEPLIFNETTALAVDSTFLELFGFPMQQGDATALDAPESIVLTEKTARKYFGSEPALGKSLALNDRLFKVTGILTDLPSNSTLQFDFLLPTRDFRVVEIFSWSWIWLQMDTWVKFRQPVTNADVAKLEAKFPAMVQKYAPAAFERVGQNLAEQLKRGDRYNVRLLPLTQLHLSYTDLDTRLRTLGDGKQVTMFGFIGLIILLLACINFVNLTTARTVKRAKEVGIRKALGSSRAGLIGQFLVESFLFSLTAILIAVFLVTLALPLFNQLTGITFNRQSLYRTDVLCVVVLLPVLVGLTGGLYPAFYLSGFRTIDTIKQSFTSKNKGLGSVRSALVVFQFAVSIALMLGAFIVHQQLNFAQQSRAGLQKENVLIINNVRHFATPSEREVFRQKLLQLPQVVQVTHSSFLPSLGSFGDFYEPEQGEQSHPVVANLPISSFLTDEYFVPTLQLQLIAGRNFRPDALADSSAVILNETAVKTIGWTNPIGKWLRYPGNRNQRFQVIGVMKDFHSASVRTAIEPTAIFHESSKTYRTWGSYMAVRLRPGTEKAFIAQATNLWKTVIPTVPFEYNFLDAAFANLYRTEAQTASVLLVFTGLALFIGCLGLFALAAFTAESRTKEIGIRKVLGATVGELVALLAKEFVRLIAISFVIAVPIAWYAMHEWLQSFAYQTEIRWWIFAAAGLVALLVALVTVSFQAVKAALTNPSKSLRSE